MVLVHRRVVDDRLQTTWPLDGGFLHHLGGPQPKATRERTSDAVALSSPHLTHLGPKVSCDHNLGPNSIHVALKSFQIKSNPVVVVAIVHPQHILILVVRRHVTVAVAGVDIKLTVTVHIPRGKAVHGVVVGKCIGHFCEGVVAVVVVQRVGASSVDQVHEPVVVKVLQFGLQEKPFHFQATSFCDVVEMAGAIVLHEVERGAVVRHQAVKIPVVVNVSKISCPALLVKHQAALQGLLCPTSIAVVHPELVHATWILGVVHELPALRDEQINVPIAVEITPYRTVVSTVVIF